MQSEAIDFLRLHAEFADQNGLPAVADLLIDIAMEFVGFLPDPAAVIGQLAPAANVVTLRPVIRVEH
jgi:hypothetical protein